MKALIAFMVAAAAGQMAPDNQTVWWRTNGAVVVGFHKSDDCSLLLYHASEDQGLAITWGKQSYEVELVDFGKQFESAPAAIQIGNTWLNDPGRLDARATGDGHALTVALPTSPESLISSADHVTIKLQHMETTLPLPHAKMPALMAAVGRCRRSLH